MHRRLILALFVVLFLFSIISARTKVADYVRKGGKVVKTSTTTSYKLMETYPGATVTVYKRGTTTLAAIYSDSAGTIKANPFTANSIDASYSFYIDLKRYDIKFSGLGIVTPYTLGDIFVNDSNDSFDVKIYGASCNGVTNDTPSILAANADAILVGGEVTIPPGVCIVNNLTIGDVKFYSAGKLSINSGQTLAVGQVDAPKNRQVFTGTGNIRVGSQTVRAIWFRGTDFSTRVTDADIALSTNVGTIYWEGNANWSTSIILSNNHTIRLGDCILTTTVPFPVVPILLKSNTAIKGNGMYSSIIKEPTYNTGTPGSAWLKVISSYGASVYPFNIEDDNLEVSDLQVQGANTFGDGGIGSAIGIGNGKSVTINRVFINGTHGLGVTLGGLNNSGLSCPTCDGGPTATRDGGIVTNSIFKNIWGQMLNVVNGKNIVLSNNVLSDMALTGCFMDMETNTGFDFQQSITINGNSMSAENTPAGNFPNGICVTNANNSFRVGNIVITNNTYIGGKVPENDGVITTTSSSCIQVAYNKDVIVSHNICRRTGQAGFVFLGDRFMVDHNILESVGGGGSPGMSLQVADSKFDSNFMLTRINSVISQGSASDIIIENPVLPTTVVNTSGVTVTRVSGQTFMNHPTIKGQIATINGSPYTVDTVISSTQFTTTAAVGAQTGVTCTFNPITLFDRNTYSMNESDYTTWTGVNSTNPIVLTGANSKILSHFDRTTNTLYQGNMVPLNSTGSLGNSLFTWTLQTGSTTARPTCNAGNRGKLYHFYGGAGVKDTVDICTKDVADVYAWRTIY